MEHAYCRYSDFFNTEYKSGSEDISAHFYMRFDN